MVVIDHKQKSVLCKNCPPCRAETENGQASAELAMGNVALITQLLEGKWRG